MKIFCVGIGGIGLSGVAQIFRSEGNEVLGSDSSLSEITESLEQSGIKIYGQHKEENIDESFDMLIYSEAVPIENPERVAAEKYKINQISYAEALGLISENKKTIAITGTHGKTTVTGMLTSILLQSQLDPTIIIGSKIDLLDNQNYRVGSSNLFLTEACEYRGNFLKLFPDIILINNLEPDHLDFFETAENYYNAFQKLIEKIPEDGVLIIYENDQDKIDLTKVKASVKIISKEVFKDKKYDLSIPGIHNQMNAYAAESTADALGISKDDVFSGLKKFNGTWRRFEYKGEINGAKVYDDYGHHPSEIKATIQAAREIHGDKQLVLVFQPHQYSRTKLFFDDFSSSFYGATEVWITDIYQARDSESDISSTSAEQLSEAINEKQNSKYVPLSELPNKIKSKAEPDKVYLIMGAGSIHELFLKLEVNK